MLGTITCRCDSVTDYYSNPMGKIHGGAMLTWLDCLTSVGIYAFDDKERMASVSLNITADFLSAGSIGKPVFFVIKILKVGRSIAFTEFQMLDGKGRLLSSMTHKKAFVPGHEAKM